jgi:hypothetical protein
MQQDSLSSFATIGFLVVVIASVIAAVYAVSSLLGRSNRGDTSQGQAAARPNKQMGPLGYIVVGFLVVGALTMTSVRRDRNNDIQIGTVPADNHDVARQTSLTGQDDEGGSEIDLPEWTRTKEVVVEKGRIPKVHFVAKSSQKPTLKEARTDAITKASTVLKDRWKDLYPDLVARKDILDEKAFAEHSQQDKAVVKIIKEAGGTDYEMFEYYVLFEDSVAVREPIVDAWRATLVDKRTGETVFGAGAVALILGTISAFFRVFLAVPGYRKKPIVAATTLGLGTAALFLMA